MKAIMDARAANAKRMGVPNLPLKDPVKKEQAAAALESSENALQGLLGQFAAVPAHVVCEYVISEDHDQIDGLLAELGQAGINEVNEEFEIHLAEKRASPTALVTPSAAHRGNFFVLHGGDGAGVFATDDFENELSPLLRDSPGLQLFGPTEGFVGEADASYLYRALESGKPDAKARALRFQPSVGDAGTGVANASNTAKPVSESQLTFEHERNEAAIMSETANVVFEPSKPAGTAAPASKINWIGILLGAAALVTSVMGTEAALGAAHAGSRFAVRSIESGAALVNNHTKSLIASAESRTRVANYLVAIALVSLFYLFTSPYWASLVVGHTVRVVRRLGAFGYRNIGAIRAGTAVVICYMILGRSPAGACNIDNSPDVELELTAPLYGVADAGRVWNEPKLAALSVPVAWDDSPLDIGAARVSLDRMQAYEARADLSDLVQRLGVPAMLNTDSTSSVGANEVTIGDTGAGATVLQSLKHAIPGTIRRNDTVVDTAGGPMTPKFRCDATLNVKTLAGRKQIKLDNCLVLDACKFNLVPLARLALEGVCGLHVPLVVPGVASKGPSLTFPDGDVAPILNVNVLVIPDAEALDRMIEARSKVAACAGTALAASSTRASPSLAEMVGAVDCESVTSMIDDSMVECVVTLEDSTTYLYPAINRTPTGGRAADHVVTRGGSGGRAVKPLTVHQRFGDRGARQLRNLPKCTRDADPEWSKLPEMPPCDDCLQGNSDRLASSSHAPEAKTVGYFSFDTYELGAPHVRGGERYVFGIHCHRSGKDFVYKMKRKNEAAECMRAFHRECRRAGHVIRHVHTDNAKEFISDNGVRGVVEREMHATMSTCAPDDPRGNGVMERRWRIMGRGVRPMLIRAKLPTTFGWYALESFVEVAGLLPINSDPTNCPDSIWNANVSPEKPSCKHVRVWGCLSYPKLMHTMNKHGPQAVRGINLGHAVGHPSNVYRTYVPAARSIIIGPTVRMVETCFPGLSLDSKGFEGVVPDFARDFDAEARRVTEPPLPPPSLGAEPTLLDDDDDGEPASETRPAPARPAPTRPTPVPQQASGGEAGGLPSLYRVINDDDQDGADHHDPDEDPISVRLQQRKAQGRPDGDVASVASPPIEKPAGSFILYLFSGPRRPGDLAEQVAARSDLSVVSIDIKIGGYAHDLRRPEVTERCVELASDPRCAGVVAAVPCSTWSVARLRPPTSHVRDLDHLEGLPLADGSLPVAARQANAMLSSSIRIAGSAVSHGGLYLFESPPGRGAGSAFEMDGRAAHAPMWAMPAMIEFAKTTRGAVTLFDQCETGAASQKTTQLLSSPQLHPYVHDRLGTLVCSHAQHPPLHETAASAEYTPELNRRLAEAIIAASKEPKPIHVHPELKLHLAKSIERVRFATEPPSPTEGGSVASTLDAIDDMWGVPACAASTTDDDLVLFAELDAAVSASSDYDFVTKALAVALDYANEMAFGEDASVVEQAKGHLQRRALAVAALTDLLPAISLSAQREREIEDRSRERAAKGEKRRRRRGRGVPVYGVSRASRGDTDNPSYRAAMNGPERRFWEDACAVEMQNLDQHGAYRAVPEDSLPTWSARRGRATEVVDCLWVLKKKYNEVRELIKGKARCVFDGAAQKRMHTKVHGADAPKLETFSPTVRHTSFKALVAASCARPAGPHPIRRRAFDVTAAYLQGEYDGEVVVARPPAGFRTFDRRGVPIVWILTGPLYGEADAGRIWNRTFLRFMIEELNMTQSDADPCIFSKIYPSGGRIDVGVYVDDGYAVDNAGPEADADVEALRKRFKIGVLEDDPKFFLGMNIIVESERRVRITQSTYVTQMADKYLGPAWRERAPVAAPGKEGLLKAYETALKREHTVSTEQRLAYQGKVGALIYTTPCARPDAAYTIGRLSRALTFPTPELEAAADHAMLYLAQHADDGLIYDGDAPDSAILKGYCDSDWTVGHSTTGYAIFLAGAVIGHSSKRQACIAASSTEAEVIAASSTSLEIVYFRRLLDELGLPQEGPTELYVDNTGAIALARDRRSCNRSRHIERRHLKVREYVAEDKIRVSYIASAENPSDVLTKTLSAEDHARHSRTLMGV